MKKRKASVLSIEPWGMSLEERLKVFRGAKKNSKKVALYFVKGPDSSTFRYRCFNTYQATLNSNEWQAVFFYRNEIKEVHELISKSDLVVLGRQCRWDSVVKSVVDEAKTNGVPVVFDLDDLVFDKKYLSVVMNTIGEFSSLDYWIPYFMDINQTAKNVDGFIVTNEFLGEKIKESFGKPYKVIRNSLNDEQMAASNVYLGMKDELKDAGHFVIGYFSGSPTHVNDLEVALPEILAFLKTHDDAILRVVGLMDFDARSFQLIRDGRIEFVSPVDFRKLQRLMASVDVNIAPLVINDFTNCKSELKFFEAAVVETITIASPTYTFEKAIKNGENGFLAQQGEWYDRLNYIYNNSDKSRAIARKAREYAIKHYCGAEFLNEVVGTYDYFTK